MKPIPLPLVRECVMGLIDSVQSMRFALTALKAEESLPDEPLAIMERQLTAVTEIAEKMLDATKDAECGVRN